MTALSSPFKFSNSSQRSPTYLPCNYAYTLPKYEGRGSLNISRQDLATYGVRSIIWQWLSLHLQMSTKSVKFGKCGCHWSGLAKSVVTDRDIQSTRTLPHTWHTHNRLDETTRLYWFHAKILRLMPGHQKYPKALKYPELKISPSRTEPSNLVSQISIRAIVACMLSQLTPTMPCFGEQSVQQVLHGTLTRCAVATPNHEELPAPHFQVLVCDKPRIVHAALLPKDDIEQGWLAAHKVKAAKVRASFT